MFEDKKNSEASSENHGNVGLDNYLRQSYKAVKKVGWQEFKSKRNDI